MNILTKPLTDEEAHLIEKGFNNNIDDIEKDIIVKDIAPRLLVQNEGLQTILLTRDVRLETHEKLIELLDK